MIVLKTGPYLLERWFEVTVNEGSTVSTCSKWIAFTCLGSVMVLICCCL